MPQLGPRLVVAGASSGCGKTTVATGLMAAMGSRGMRVASCKVGPDFIDPGYHGLATGRPGRNLDSWMCGPDRMAPLAARAGEGADVLVVEGVMGLFDGSGDPDGPEASTAEMAELLEAPVILVVDAAAVGASVAAVVHGFSTFDSSVAIAGVILNRVGSDGHEQILRAALQPIGLPVLGALRRDPAMEWRDRHLGLVPVVEDAGRVRRSLDVLAAAVERQCDVGRIADLAAAAPRRRAGPPPEARPRGRARVAVAGGAAFSFTYADNLEILQQAGAEIMPFDPLSDPLLPPGVDALYAGGGFPEVFGERLAENHALLADVKTRVADGLVTWAECGGLLWLSRGLDGHTLAGAVEADATMTDRLTLGYRRTRFLTGTPLGPAGTEMRGHEFHYSQITPAGEAMRWRGRTAGGVAGFAGPSLLASYVHLHLASDPRLAERLVARASAARPLTGGNRTD